MKTIEKYVFGSFLTSFLLAFLVLSFVLTIALMVQIVGYILDGVSMRLVGEFAMVSFPETLQWTVPLALLVSSVLVFSRLSADSEVAAMRACGVNLLSVMKWPVVFALACSLASAWVNNEIVPREYEVRRNLKSKVSVDTGIDLLEPGRWIDDFPRMKIYCTRKEGNWIYDLNVIDYTMTNGLLRTITASKALVHAFAIYAGCHSILREIHRHLVFHSCNANGSIGWRGHIELHQSAPVQQMGGIGRYT